MTYEFQLGSEVSKDISDSYSVSTGVRPWTGNIESLVTTPDGRMLWLGWHQDPARIDGVAEMRPDRVGGRMWTLSGKDATATAADYAHMLEILDVAAEQYPQVQALKRAEDDRRRERDDEALGTGARIERLSGQVGDAR